MKFNLIKIFIISLLFCGHTAFAANNAKTIVISAEGLADPSSPAYQRDKGVLLDALRSDARRQVIEKAVGTMVQSSTLIENYEMIHDRVLTQSAGLIKKIIKQSKPWMGDDGFMHMLLKAEVYVDQVKDALDAMSASERLTLLKQYDNPKISVSVWVKGTERGANIRAERSDIAENILKEHLKSFGYRVWSDGETNVNGSDFTISGTAKFKPVSVTLRASGVTITKYVLTSWTVKCIDKQTGEEIYFNNAIPKKKSWADEDVALGDIGKLIGQEFSKDFFDSYLISPSKIFQMQVFGIPDYDVAKVLKKELIGLRAVLNVDLRDFDRNNASVYEIDFAGNRGDFQGLINDTLIYPLNQKLGQRNFRLDSARGNVVKISFKSDQDINQLMASFNGTPPASLATAAPGRLKNLVLNETTRQKIATINPSAVKTLESKEESKFNLILDTVDDF